MRDFFLYFPPADRRSCPWRRESGLRVPGDGARRRRPKKAASGGALWSIFPGLLVVLFVLGAGAQGRAAAAPSGDQEPPNTIQVRSSEQLFATLCALYAAGYPDIPADTPPELRKIVLHFATAGDPRLAALRAFYKAHQLGSNQATLARYVSFAMVVGPPPQFEYLVPEEGLP